MVQIGFIDDGIGVCAAALRTLKSVGTDCIAMICSGGPFCKMRLTELADLAESSAKKLQNAGCDAVVFCSPTMSYAAKKRNYSLPVYFCETPVMHSATYTASSVVVFGDRYSARQVKIPNAIVVCAEDFRDIALTGSDRQIAAYVENKLAPYEGKFDCIAVSDGLMSLKSSCFNMAFPGVRVFDCVDGVVRRLKKTYEKTARKQRKKSIIEPSVKFVNGLCEAIAIKSADFTE